MKILRIIIVLLLVWFTISGTITFLISAQNVPDNAGILVYLALFIGSFALSVSLFFLVKYLNKKIAENEKK